MIQPFMPGKRVDENKPEKNLSPPRAARVLHLINGEHYSGAERVQDLLGLRLPEFGFEASFVCLKPGLFPSQRKSRGCQLFEVPMKGRFDRNAARSIAEIARNGDFELLHAHTPRSLLVGSRVARASRMPLIYHVHSPAGRDSTRWLGNRINTWVETWSSRRVNHFICVSESVKRYMQELGHLQQKLTTVPNGVAIVADLPDRDAPKGTWTIGTTALFRPRKGIEVLLKAMALLRQSGADVKLLAVGPFETTEYENTIRTLACSLNIEKDIEWTGYADDVNSHFRRMDLFVLPSLFGEGLPMVILEAMANGVPVIAANVEGIPQAIRDGIDGLIFEPGNPDELAARALRYMAGKVDWRQIRESARKRQQENFSDSSMAEGVAAVYERVLAEFAR
jgi:glycosyltransferase involved in cell wall biosynthesis